MIAKWKYCASQWQIPSSFETTLSEKFRSSNISGPPAVLIRIGTIGSIQPLVISAITSRSPANLPPLPYLRFVFLPHAESCAHTYALAPARHAAERQNGEIAKEANKEN